MYYNIKKIIAHQKELHLAAKPIKFPVKNYLLCQGGKWVPRTAQCLRDAAEPRFVC
jgi:hypothetical protein